MCAKPEEFYKPHSDLLKKIGTTILNERNKKKLTQEQLATRAGLHWRYIQMIESGTRNISISVFYDLAKGLDLSPLGLLKKVEAKV